MNLYNYNILGNPKNHVQLENLEEIFQLVIFEEINVCEDVIICKKDIILRL
jgi:hypothetical protein